MKLFTSLAPVLGTLLATSALAQSVPPLTPEDASPYARWEHGPPPDPSWFPIGVWLQDPRLAPRYARLGVNTFVGLWKGPTEAQLDALEESGMAVICSQNRLALARAERSRILAWMLVDEPDNRGPRASGPKATPAEVAEAARLLREHDPTRPVWLNLGQGVANDRWKGLGASRSDYPAYARIPDLLSFDVYPVTNLGLEDGERFLWFLAKGLGRLRRWGGEEKVLWNFIETTRGPHRTKKPTPEQVRAEVWISLVSGSRGIVYFCHEFEPEVEPAALLADPEQCRAVQALNEEVLGFAPWLNAPTDAAAATLEGEDERVPLALLAKRRGDVLTLFAINLRAEETRGRLRIAAPGADTLHVLGEDRTLEAAGGEFEDRFGPYELHVYRLGGE